MVCGGPRKQTRISGCVSDLGDLRGYFALPPRVPAGPFLLGTEDEERLYVRDEFYYWKVKQQHSARGGSPARPRVARVAPPDFRARLPVPALCARQVKLPFALAQAPSVYLYASLTTKYESPQLAVLPLQTPREDSELSFKIGGNQNHGVEVSEGGSACEPPQKRVWRSSRLTLLAQPSGERPQLGRRPLPRGARPLQRAAQRAVGVGQRVRISQGGATLASPRPDTGRSPTAFKVQALARCTWVSSLPLPPDKPTPAHTQSHSGHRMTPNDSLCVLRQNLRRQPKRAVPRLWCLLKH